MYQVDEPDPFKKAAKDSPPLKPRATWQLRFPEKPFDCESLFVWNGYGYGYVISKLLDAHDAGLYRFPLAPQRVPAILEKVTDLPIRSPVTGADISADGRKLAVITVTGPYLFTIEGDPANAGRSKPQHVTFIKPSIEAICFTREGLLVTAESREIYLFRFDDFIEPKRAALPAELKLDLPAVARPPLIDRKLDDWDMKAEPVTLQSAVRPPTGPPPPRLWARWGEKGIYIAGIATQAKVAPLQKAWYTGDAVEIFLGRDAPDRPAEYGAGDDRCYLDFAQGADGSAGPICIGPAARPRRPAPKPPARSTLTAPISSKRFSPRRSFSPPKSPRR